MHFKYIYLEMLNFPANQIPAKFCISRQHTKHPGLIQVTTLYS